MLMTYTKQMEPLKLRDKKEIHKVGLWHKVATGIVYNPSTNKVYFQTIYPKESYGFDRPDYVDFSVGGHVEELETPFESLIREGKEEIGIDINNFKPEFLMVRRIIADPSDSYSIREFQYIYALCNNTIGLNSFDMQGTDNEVKSIVEINVDDLIVLLDKNVDEIECKAVTFAKDTRKAEGISTFTMTRNNLIPDYLTQDFFVNILYTLKNI